MLCVYGKSSGLEYLNIKNPREGISGYWVSGKLVLAHSFFWAYFLTCCFNILEGKTKALAHDSEPTWSFYSSLVRHNLSPSFLLFYSLASCLILCSLLPWFTHLDVIYCPDNLGSSNSPTSLIVCLPWQ